MSEKSFMVSFEVKQMSVEKVNEIIREFVYNIHNNEPDTLLYKSFQQINETGRYTHIMTFADGRAEEKHRNSGYCKVFVEELYPLCIENPKPIIFKEII